MLATYLSILKNKQLKLTPKRKAILELFINEGIYLTPEYVWEKLKNQFKALGLPGIYRNLQTFEDCHILVRILREDRRLHYALCHGEMLNHHHHHILCLKCGKVADVDICLSTPVQRIKGFKVLRHIMQFEGVCDNCSKR